MIEFQEHERKGESELGGKPTGVPEAVGSGEATRQEPLPIEPLRLPRGALLAFSKCRATNPNLHAVVIYPDGRIAYSTRPIARAEYTHLPRVLNDGQIARLRHMLDRIGFWRMPSGPDTLPAAGYAYHIAARSGPRTKLIRVSEDSIPDNLAELIETLVKYLPREEESAS